MKTSHVNTVSVSTILTEQEEMGEDGGKGIKICLERCKDATNVTGKKRKGKGLSDL